MAETHPKPTDPRFKDLTGKHFGRLAVVRYAGKNESRKTQWLCLCSCGKTTTVSSNSLLRGDTASCGCLCVELRSSRRLRDLTGVRFGKLVVLHRAGTIGSKTRWLCRCDCGGSITTLAASLVSGATTSCGCAHIDAGVRRRVDLSGTRFGRLVATRTVPSKPGRVTWECICDCGRVVRVRAAYLVNGDTKSCGCRQHGNNKTHGGTGTAEYTCWKSMISRCETPSATGYRNYGGRGISVCSRWRRSFPAFLRDMGLRPHPDWSIDRKDNDGNYTPKNCRWADPKTQHDNQRRYLAGKSPKS